MSAFKTTRCFVMPLAALSIAAGCGVPRKRDITAESQAPDLREPEVRRSQGGVLSTKLTLQLTRQRLGDRDIEIGAYEGSTPGPTWRVRPGDVLKIHLENRLALPGQPTPAATDDACKDPNAGGMAPMDHGHDPQMALWTNLHTHGLQVSPAGNADNPFKLIKPGAFCDYVIPIPKDQPAGLYWYHPHHHGSTARQTWSGIAGAIIVEGDIDRVPEVAAARERLLVLQELWIDETGRQPQGMVVPSTGVTPFTTIPAVPSNMYLTVNGQWQPTIRIRPGEVQRWRVVAASAHRSFLLALDGHELHQIAQDGISLPALKSRRQILMASGNRIQILVRGGEPGVYQLRALAYDQGHPGEALPERVLANVIVEGERAEGRLPSKLIDGLPDIRNDPVHCRRKIVFSGDIESAPVAFFLNHQMFDPDRDDQVVQAGATDEWLLVNEDVFQHPFHIHVNPFQIVAINGVPVDDPTWWDTIPLPAHGSITMRTRYRPDVLGRSVYHCHILPHEDNGMMANLRIAEQGTCPAGGQP